MAAKKSTAVSAVRSSRNNKQNAFTATITASFDGTASNFADRLEDVFMDYGYGTEQYKINVKKVTSDELEKALA